VIGQLARHASRLSIANLLVTIAGLVSFPILTRLLSVDDYGLMNLVATMLAILVAVSKFGVQTASVRFYGDALSEADPSAVERWASTVVVGMSTVGAVACVGWWVVALVLPDGTWGDPRIPALLLLAVAMVFVQVSESALCSLLRAQLLTGATALYFVVKRYAILAATLGALIWIAPTVWVFYGAILIVESLAVVALFGWIRSRIALSLTAADRALYGAMFVFGIPMIGTELSSQVLTMGDRYVIQRLLGSGQLGLYTASYNLCEYVRVVCLAGFVQALMPMYVRSWSESGRAETERMLSRVTGLYALIAFPTVAGLAAVGDVLVPILASSKYSEGSAIIPWVIAGMALEAYSTIAMAGLLIEKRTRAALAILVGAAVLNIALNLWWIPRWGLIGSAAATLASYAAVVAAGTLAGRAVLRPTPPYAQIARYAVGATVMYASIAALTAGGPVATLTARIVVGALCYVAVVLAIDPESRRLATATLHRLRRQPT